MPRSCSVCSNPEAVSINEALVPEKRSNRAIARQYELHHDAVRRHREHIPELLARAAEHEAVLEAGDLLSRIEALQSRTLAVLEAVEETGNHSTALAAIREARSNLELIGRVTKELESGATLNLP